MTFLRESIDFLNDILTQISKINKFLSETTFDQFIQNDEKVSAIIYCLAVIGEAANKVSKQIKGEHKDIKWRKMISMRNILIHYYYGADEKVIWKTIKNDLPNLELQIKALIIEINKTNPEN